MSRERPSHIVRVGIMSKPFFWTCGCWLICVATLTAQQIEVRKAPPPKAGPGEEVVYDQWTVSYSRRANPGVYELDSFHKTEAAARARADKIRAWSATITDRDWKIAIILIEGEASVRNKQKPTDPKLPMVKLKPNMKPGDVLNEYRKRIQNAYENAKQLRANMITRTGRLSESTFRDVNKTIAEFNALREEGVQVTGDPFKEYPPLDPLSPREMKANVVRDITMPDIKWVDTETPSDPVAGKKASGKLNIRDLYVSFGTDGTISAYTHRNYTEKAYTGRYTITGDRIEFELGPSKFVGTIKGNRITGTRERSDGINDEWELTLDD